MKIFVVILNWNGKEFIFKCLDSVKKLEIGRASPKAMPAARNLKLEIVVVDNASTDGSVEQIKSEKLKMKNDKAKLKIIENNQNLGFAEGNNVGIRYALKNGADYVLILNPDTIVDENLILQLISASGGSAFGGKVARADSRIGILGPKIYFAPGFEFHKERYKPEERGKVIWYAGGRIDWNNVLSCHRGVDEIDRGQYDKVEETDFVSGCCMFVKKEVFEKIGLFDPKYFLYWEDSDFCQRAWMGGFRIVYVPGANVFHLDAGSSAVGGPLHDYYITRNRMLFGIKYASFRTKFALVRESIKLFFFGRPWQKIGIRDFYLWRFGKGSWKT
ncbi:MAG: glycosyltransferase family 2 protein [Patescibacteria group bacterium]